MSSKSERLFGLFLFMVGLYILAVALLEFAPLALGGR